MALPYSIKCLLIAVEGVMERENGLGSATTVTTLPRTPTPRGGTQDTGSRGPPLVPWT